MRIPRWTVYPAVALIATLMIMAIPRDRQSQNRGAAWTSRQGHEISPTATAWPTGVGPRTVQGIAAPSEGCWTVGDIVRHSCPQQGGSLGWVCIDSGEPGSWASFGGDQD